MDNCPQKTCRKQYSKAIARLFRFIFLSNRRRSCYEFSYRSHALRGNAVRDAQRLAPLERCILHSHAERGNDKKK
ncbi:MAG: hypothetical protein EPN89_17440 [Methylovulum sp.]|nr:MAG: hypothetical protein EPN89_17440 [Methylovulum sp.]